MIRNTRYILWDMKGQTLIEVLVALAVAMVIVTAVTSTVLSSLRSARQNTDKNMATQYAQEGLEIVRQAKEANFTKLFNETGIYCVAKDQQLLGARSATCSTPNIGKFIRVVTIERSSSTSSPNCGLNALKATVTISWNDSTCSPGQFCKDVKMSTCLVNIRSVSIP